MDREVEKPIIIIAQDNSESLIIGDDSTFLKVDYPEELKAMINSFGEGYEVKSYTFGEKLNDGIENLNYTGKSTNFSNLLDEIYTKFSNRNLGAIIIGSDGLYNEGINPRYSFKKLDVPVYTIALGDTTEKRDVLISEVRNNRLAYLGNRFPVNIFIDARKAAGEELLLSISRKENVVFSQKVSVSKQNYQEEVFVNLDAIEVGLQRYSVRISTIENEITTINNRQDIFIDVLDSKQKILFLAHSPHPDLAAFKSSIESNRNYQVETKLSADFDGNFSDYNLVVFHQIPDVTAKSLEQVQTCLQKNVPALFVVGSQSSYAAFNELNLGYDYTNTTDQLNEVNAYVQSGFNLFNLSDGVKNLIRNLPPLHVSFGNFDYSEGVNSLINQRLGSIETADPLISFNEFNGTKIGLIGGEGIWRWRTVGYLENNSHDNFNELTTKIIQYLAAKDDKSQFRVDSKTDFVENEDLIFNAQLYNEIYEPINDRSVSIKIFNEEGQEYDYEFTKTDRAYRLNAGSLDAGNYKYEANTNYNGKLLKEIGEFSIRPIFLEQINTTADHRLLFNFAKENGGRMVSKDEVSSLSQIIKDNEIVVTTTYETKILSDLINLKWILGLLLGLLCLEWLIRKRQGTY